MLDDVAIASPPSKMVGLQARGSLTVQVFGTQSNVEGTLLQKILKKDTSTRIDQRR